MKIYKVGGAIRDELLGLEPRDLDFLVLDSSPDEMKKLGFLQVGLSYEVFLHPRTKDEYVLASDLKQDLARRDLTINAMAKDEEGNLIDPFHGKEDLTNKILKHTSLHFADDALRIYRLARFKGQYPDFQIATETMDLCCKLISSDSFKLLNGERILGELKVALSGREPEEFFNTLLLMGAMPVHFNMIKDWSGLNEKKLDPLQAFAFLMRKNNSDEIRIFVKRLLIQNDWNEAALIASKIYFLLERLPSMNAEEIINLFYEMDAFRKPDHIQMIAVLFNEEGKRLKNYFDQVKNVSMKHIGQGLAGKDISQAIKNERIRILTL